MEPKMVGRVVTGSLTVVFALLAVIYALAARSPEALYHVAQGVVFALVAICFAVSYRYFED